MGISVQDNADMIDHTRSVFLSTRLRYVRSGSVTTRG
jgi:hypothetical protein